MDVSGERDRGAARGMWRVGAGLTRVVGNHHHGLLLFSNNSHPVQIIKTRSILEEIARQPPLNDYTKM